MADTPEPLEAIRQTQQRITEELWKTHAKAEALRRDFEREMGRLQTRHGNLMRAISILGAHATNLPPDGRIPEADWKVVEDILNTLP